jgi:hypothetical protein
MSHRAIVPIGVVAQGKQRIDDVLSKFKGEHAP